MGVSDEFIKYCMEVLEINYGRLSLAIVNKAKTKSCLNDKSSQKEYEDFIRVVESNIDVLSGKNKAIAISDRLKIKASEFSNRKNVASEIDHEITCFLEKRTDPFDAEILEKAEILSRKYGIDARKMENRILEIIGRHANDIETDNRLDEEINKFLATIPQPVKVNIEDWVMYLRIRGLEFQEEDLIQRVEKERLYRKFQEPHIVSISDTPVYDYLKLTQPSEKDMKIVLEEMGLKHMIRHK
jgi:hypothetical protein